MPISSGLGIHNDDKHMGSAKRDTVNGIAALDGSGDLLVVGDAIDLTRDIAEHIRIIERTSGESIVRWKRLGDRDYDFYFHTDDAWYEVQDSRMKDAANGIAGLDGSVEIPMALLKTNVANGIAGLDASVKLPFAQVTNDLLTVPEFQVNTATGTCGTPEDINDNDTFSMAVFNNVNEYAEIIFPRHLYITQFQHLGTAGHNGDGRWKIQYLYNGSWTDLNTGIVIITSAVWSGWVNLTTPVFCMGVRWVATTIDTGGTGSKVVELEVKA